MNNIPKTVIAERQRIIREALLQNWDPIGVSHLRGAQDEYNSYVPAIYELVASNKTRKEIVDYLWWLETQQIGLPGDPAGIERFADQLMKLRADFQIANPE